MTTVSEEVKTRAIVAHLTLIGWIIAVVQNSSDKQEHASFYIRQMLGIMIVGIGVQIIGMFLFFIPFLGWLIWMCALLIVLGAWLYSLVQSINGKKEPLPFVGQYFQQWFAGM
jgi:uncharacterized membrane protein